MWRGVLRNSILMPSTNPKSHNLQSPNRTKKHFAGPFGSSRLRGQRCDQGDVFGHFIFPYVACRVPIYTIHYVAYRRQRLVVDILSSSGSPIFVESLTGRNVSYG